MTPPVQLRPTHARHSPVSLDFALKPWRRANRLQKCFLYWHGATTFPMPAAEKSWLNHFLSRLTVQLYLSKKLRPQLYLRYRLVPSANLQNLATTSQDFLPIFGVTRPHDLRREHENGGCKAGTVEIGEGVFAEPCFRLPDKWEERNRAAILGFGGMIMLFRQQPSSSISAPSLPEGLKTHPMFQSLFQAFDVDRIIGNLASQTDGSLRLSKEVFASDLMSDPLLKKIPFVVPLLRSADFMAQSEEDTERLFSFCDLYISESPADNGILMASKTNFEPAISQVLAEMLNEAATRNTE